jgi:NADH:ubiquinone oxidoreductase subunit E
MSVLNGVLNVLERILEERGLSEQDALEIIEDKTGIDFKQIESVPSEYIDMLIKIFTENKKRF